MRISCYNVFDLVKDEYIAKNINYIQVSELIGISKIKVCQYSKEGYIYHKRYEIENVETEQVPDEVMIEWDRLRLELNPNAKVR